MMTETSPPITSELLASLNAAFDRSRVRLGFTSDRELAEHYDVSTKSISFWRTGRWTNSDTALISMLTVPENP